ncbi:hypothetical protein U9M48_040776, partial [Paspalum notatum var. saurae]
MQCLSLSCSSYHFWSLNCNAVSYQQKKVSLLIILSPHISVSLTVSTRAEAMSTTLALATGTSHMQHLHPSKYGHHPLSPGPHHHHAPSLQPLAMAATLSSVAAPSIPKRGSIVRAQQQSPPAIISASTKTAFHGVSLVDSRWSSGHRRGSGRRRLLQVNARSTAAKNIEVEVDKPLGLALGQKPGGGVVITSVESGGNAAKAGLKAGDQVLYTSSFFGDELWPADKLGFTKTAIQAKSDSVYFVVSRGGGDVDVKRLPKRPAPPRATHICLDCGYIYFLPKPFEEQPDDYGCPQCNAAKKRFAKYDPATGRAIGGTLPPIAVIISLVIGIAGVGALLVRTVEVIMSYWGSAGGSPAWGSSRGPSPVVPLLVVMALGWVIWQETLTGWYEQVTEVQETVTDNAVILVLGAGLLLLAIAVAGSRSEVVLVPVALVVIMFLIQNIMLASLLLLVVVYFAGIYCYPPDRGYYGGGIGGSEWGGGGGGGLGFYMLLLLCLVLCAMFSDDGGSWWIPGVMLVACVLCFNLFSGGKVW